MATAQQYPSDCGYNNHGYHHQQFLSNMMGGQYGFNGGLSNSYNNNNNNHHYSNWNQYYQYQQHHQNVQHQDNNLLYNDYFRPNRFTSPYTCEGNQSPFATLDNNYSNKNNGEPIANGGYFATSGNASADNEQKELPQEQAKLSTPLNGNFPKLSSPSIMDNAGSPHESIKSINSLKRKCENSPIDSPSLRALLTNPKLKYSPTYSLADKRSPIVSTTDDNGPTKEMANPNKDPNAFDVQFREQNWSNNYYSQYGGIAANSNNYRYDSAIPSPNKTEDSMDFFDYNMRKDMANKDGFEQHPPTMTSTILNTTSDRSPITSPLSSYVDSISTPPLSPKEENQHINHTNKRAMSSPDKSYVWIQNGNDCKYAYIVIIIFSP